MVLFGEGGTGKRTPKSRNLLLQSKPGASSAEELEKQWVNFPENTAPSFDIAVWCEYLSAESLVQYYAERVLKWTSGQKESVANMRMILRGYTWFFKGRLCDQNCIIPY